MMMMMIFLGARDDVGEIRAGGGAQGFRPAHPKLASPR